MIRCPGCRSRRSTWQLMLKHIDLTGHKVCDCGQGRHYPHRPGSSGCVQEPWDDLFDTRSPKAAPPGAPCPF